MYVMLAWLCRIKSVVTIGLLNIFYMALAVIMGLVFQALQLIINTLTMFAMPITAILTARKRIVNN